MILSIARQSVVIKCNMASSIMTGNYEFYYATGLLFHLTGVTAAEAVEPSLLMEQVQHELRHFSSEDKREMHLIRMLMIYKPVSTFDEQMKELFWMGYREQNMWRELLPQT